VSVNNLINRTGLDYLIPPVVQKEIISAIPEQSAVLSMMRRLPDMTTNQTQMPIIGTLPNAYFVGENAAALLAAGTIKNTTAVTWTHKTLYAEEIACIVPIPENVLGDSNYDVWSEIKPSIIEAFGIKLDGAVLVGGADCPATWPNPILDDAATAANTVEIGTGTDLADDVNSLMACVEADGYEVNGFLAPVTTKARLRGLRSADGELLFMPTLQASTPDNLYGYPIKYLRNGALSASDMHMLAGDFSQAVYSIRQDLTFKVLTEATIYDSSGVVQFALAQQDMVALRCIMRIGWQLPNPVNRLQPTEANRYPFAALVPVS
jgi:HK97 family phage major capsid protein